MKNLFNRFVREEEGQDLVEYGLLLGVITVAAITMILAIGGQVTNLFTSANTAISAAPGAGS
jgi:pilus assembly protein Flp/PilA